MATTHDYRRSVWGHACNVIKVIDGGQGLDLSGFGRSVKKGDFVILSQRDGSTTRYKITKIMYNSNVYDLWFARAKFAPRQEETAQAQPDADGRAKG